jgi:hypothetical protein
MTAITLNLLAEEQRAQEARARDPIKLFVAIGLAALTVAVGTGATLSAVLMQKRSELQGLEAEWNSINNGGAQEGEFQQASALAEEIVALNRSRVLFAPQLALVKDVVPSSVQLSQINFALSKEAPQANSGSEGDNGGKHPSHRKGSERLALRLEGIASSSRPELEVDQFITTLRADQRFNAAVEDIQLRSISRISRDSDKTGGAPSAASFVIECWYKDNVEK